MEKGTKPALFVGGSVDGQIIEVDENELRLKFHGSFYNSKGTLTTERYGTVLLYVSKAMNSREERRRMEIIRKVL